MRAAKLRVTLLAATLVAVACSESGTAVTPREAAPVSRETSGLAAWVDPFLGTGNSASPDPVGNGAGGSTFPGPTVPFGMVQFSPDTPHAAPPGYFYADDTIAAFSLTHLNGAGCPAQRDFPLFPFVARPDFTVPPEDHFSHADEKASPGFYEVKLASGILVDLTATERSGLARFTFPAGADGHILISAATASDRLTTKGFDAKIVGSDRVTGSRAGGAFCFTNSSYRVYFAARFDRPFDGFGVERGGEPADGDREVDGPSSGAYFRFGTGSSRVVHMKMGLSYVSAENALKNLDAENPGWDFDAVHAQALSKWNERLGKVVVDGGSDDERRAFYTALYHTMVQPAVFSDVDGSYVGFDKQVRSDPAHVRYANFSGWDVYRSWIQLAAMLAPKEASDLVRSLIGAGQECGALPKWSLANDETGVMVGDPACPTIANAWAFGARDFDAQAALALMKKGATDPGAKCNAYTARLGLSDYMTRGYCSQDGPDKVVGSASVTQEYAVADFAIAQLAGAIGDATTHDTFAARALAWKNVFNGKYDEGGMLGMAQPRNQLDVDTLPNFARTAPDGMVGFIEGNAAQYTFFVPHDAYGLIGALGGDEATVGRLDSLFAELNAGVSRPHFYMGNEPQFGTPWLYPFAGAAHRTQAVVRRILREAFNTSPGGLPGNDDLGATSAWQVWAMLGMYPAVPGTGVLVLGSPLFPKATVTLPSGAKLTIESNGGSADAFYVQALRADGQPWSRTFITWDEIQNGKTLSFDLGLAPNASWGAARSDRPPSFYP